MVKLGKLIIFMMLFSSCLNFNQDSNSLILEPNVEHYLNLYIRDNKNLDPEKNVIIITGKALEKQEFVLNILSDMQENVLHSSADINDTVYFGNYKKFRVLIIDNDHKVLKSRHNIYSPANDTILSDVTPVFYNGALWEFKIKDGKVTNFSYQFCTPDTGLIKQIRSTHFLR